MLHGPCFRKIETKYISAKTPHNYASIKSTTVYLKCIQRPRKGSNENDLLCTAGGL